jgi:beta-galactosidase/beta-glucuronidase
MESEITPEGHRLFKVNGQPLLIRGGGWTSDMMLRLDPQRLETQMRYVRDMGLNTIRLEGKLETDEFYELADRYGILVIAGWCCWTTGIMAELGRRGPLGRGESLSVPTLRNHPGVAWFAQRQPAAAGRKRATTRSCAKQRGRSRWSLGPEEARGQRAFRREMRG